MKADFETSDLSTRVITAPVVQGDGQTLADADAAAGARRFEPGQPETRVSTHCLTVPGAHLLIKTRLWFS